MGSPQAPDKAIPTRRSCDRLPISHDANAPVRGEFLALASAWRRGAPPEKILQAPQPLARDGRGDAFRHRCELAPEMAGDAVVERRHLDAAALARVRAARMEPAARRRIDRV